MHPESIVFFLLSALMLPAECSAQERNTQLPGMLGQSELGHSILPKCRNYFFFAALGENPYPAMSSNRCPQATQIAIRALLYSFPKQSNSVQCPIALSSLGNATSAADIQNDRCPPLPPECRWQLQLTCCEFNDAT